MFSLFVNQDKGALKLWVAMELCSGGSVTDLAKRMRPKALPEPVGIITAFFHINNNEASHPPMVKWRMHSLFMV